MKKVLVITNLYPLSSRMPGVTTYLPEFGWEATIITPPVGENAGSIPGFPKLFLEKAKIMEAPYKGDIFWFWRKLFGLFGFKTGESIPQQVKERAGITAKRSVIDILMNWYRTIFAYPDTERTWRKPALKAAVKILEKEHFDAVLSSSPVPTSHLVAAELKRRFGLRWVADFRDPWTQNHNYPYGPLRRHFEQGLERKVLAGADAMTAAAPAYAEKQEELHQRPVVIITNGFNPENINEPPSDLTKKFTVSYTGAIYTGKQDPEKFFVALEKLISRGAIRPDDIEVRFYGRQHNWLEDEITKHNLANVVRQYGPVPRNESWQRQRESQILLLLNWEDPDEKGVYPLKFFEYLAAQRPVLASGGFAGDDIEKLVIETKAGFYAPTVENIKASLLSFYEEYRRTSGVCYNGDSKKIGSYSYREKAKKFASLLNQLTGK
jgi:hypothetical protein